MKLGWLLSFTLLLATPLMSYGEELFAVPADLAKEVAAPLQKERAALLGEQRALKNRIQRHKNKCQKENPAMEHICHTERQSLLSAGDKLEQKIVKFNRQIRDLAKPKAAETTEPGF